jgi:hypothetical protein
MLRGRVRNQKRIYADAQYDVKGEEKETSILLTGPVMKAFDKNKKVMFTQLLFALCEFYGDKANKDFSIIEKDDTWIVQGISPTDNITVVFKSNDSGDCYFGEFKDGKKHGVGVKTWPDGCVYEGEWQEGKMHGVGTETDAEGNKYDGKWQEGEMHGEGTETRLDGSKYEGMWQEGEMHGKGVFIWPDGEKYEGQWEKGEWLTQPEPKKD